MIKISVPRTLLAAALLTAGIGATLPAQADPPHWAPAHGHRAHAAHEYRYIYYPARRVYYEPTQHLWFWMNGGGWQFGVSLPGAYRVYPDGGVPVVLHSDRPYREHVYVEEHYGRPWRARHRTYEERHVEHWEQHGPSRHEGHHDSYEHGRDHDRH